MTKEQLNKGQELLGEIATLSLRVDETKIAINELTENITKFGDATQFPVKCPLTGRSIWLSTLDLKRVYSDTVTWKMAQIATLEIEFKNL